jgi:prephenate dehydrogenase
VPVAIQKLVVVGVGLIGASFALALKEAGVVRKDVGVGRSRANLERAVAAGAIDEFAADPGAAVDGAEFVLVATPVAAMADAFAHLATRLPPGAVITDGGSTKRSVIAAARAALGPRIVQYVPAHPIAGSDESGAAAATAALYRGREVILTPLAETPHETVERVRAAWQACGARVTEMGAAEHDAVLAAVSHLPHLLSFALVHELGARVDAAGLLAHAGTGFRDVSRLAASNPEMWRDICLANRDALLAELRRYQDELERLGTALERADGETLERAFAAARAERRAWMARDGGGSP